MLYILLNTYKIEDATDRIITWIEGCEIANSNKFVILKALNSPFKDKEDAVQYHTALHNQVDYFITRNKKDYEPCTNALPVHTPSEFLAIYDQ